MDATVSIPDDVFEAAERLSRRIGTSRSDLYARAQGAYLAAHTPDRITESWNVAVDRLGAAGSDPIVRAAARQVLRSTAW